MTKGVQNDQIVCAAAVPVAEGGAALRRVRLLPIGDITLRDGRGTFVVRDLAHAQRIVAATREYAGAQSLPIDYDHQSVFGAKDGVGGVAPASGWMDSLDADATGIWANVSWTNKAASAIAPQDGTPGEYRYLSPVFGADQKRHITRLYNAALTNTPAINDLTRLAASLNLSTSQEIHMELSALAVALGLPATATQAEVDAALVRSRTAVAASADLTAVRTALGVSADAPAEALVAAATALKSNKPAAGADEIVVPASVFNDMQAQLATLIGDKVTASVDAAIKAGKIVPASRDTMLTWAKKDLSGFEAFVATAPAVAASAVLLDGKPAQDGGSAGGLTAEQKIAASVIGMSEADYLAALKAEGEAA